MRLNIVRKVVLSILSAWFAAVAFTDFVVVPTIFQTVSKRVEAAELGMKLFNTLGSFETFFAIIIFVTAGVVFKRFRTKRAAVLFLFASTLCAFALLGRFYLTPEITRLNEIKFSIDASSQEYAQLESRHQFLHGLYVKLDGAKILLLLAGLLGSFRASRFDQEKVFMLNTRKKL